MIDSDTITVRCESCGTTCDFRYDTPSNFHCRACGSTTFRLMKKVVTKSAEEPDAGADLRPGLTTEVPFPKKGSPKSQK